MSKHIMKNMKKINYIKFSLLMFLGIMTFPLMAQKDAIVKRYTSGVVQDEQGSPLVGVEVSIVDGFKQVITDLSGKFQIDVPVGESLYFNKAGYIRQKKEIDNRGTSITIILKKENMEEIYQAHARTVYKFLLSQCHDPHLAEELTQETFYQAVRSIDRFDGELRSLGALGDGESIFGRQPGNGPSSPDGDDGVSDS